MGIVLISSNDSFIREVKITGKNFKELSGFIHRQTVYDTVGYEYGVLKDGINVINTCIFNTLIKNDDQFIEIYTKLIHSNNYDEIMKYIKSKNSLLSSYDFTDDSIFTRAIMISPQQDEELIEINNRIRILIDSINKLDENSIFIPIYLFNLQFVLNYRHVKLCNLLLSENYGEVNRNDRIDSDNKQCCKGL